MQRSLGNFIQNAACDFLFYILVLNCVMLANIDILEHYNEM